MVQMQNQSSAVSPSTKSKSAPTTPVKETADMLKNNTNLIGLHLVHPSVIKPLPRHKKQPVGHRTPIRSNLYGQPLIPACPVPRPVINLSKDTNSLEMTVSPTGVPGKSCGSIPINHLVDFLPSEQKVRRKSHYRNPGRNSRMLVSPTRTREPQNEGLTAALSLHDNYRRKTGTQLSPISEKMSHFPPSKSVSSTPSSASLMSSNPNYEGPVLPWKQSTILRKGISKAVVHEADNEMSLVNSNDDFVHKSSHNVSNGVCSNQASDTITSPCSTNRQSLTETDGRKDREEIPTVAKDVTRQSPQIDLLVTTAEEDNAVRQEADTALLASRPDLLITLAGSDVPIHACDRKSVSGNGSIPGSAS